MNAKDFGKFKSFYTAPLLLLFQIILYHNLYEYVVIFNRIFVLPTSIPLIFPLLFTITYGLYSKDVRTSFLFGFLSAVVFPIDLMLTGRYIPGMYSPLAGEVAVLFMIGIASGLAGVLAVKAARKYDLKFSLIPYVYLSLGTLSMVMGMCILLKLLEYALRASQWSHDASISLVLATGAVILGVYPYSGVAKMGIRSLQGVMNCRSI